MSNKSKWRREKCKFSNDPTLAMLAKIWSPSGRLCVCLCLWLCRRIRIQIRSGSSIESSLACWLARSLSSNLLSSSFILPPSVQLAAPYWPVASSLLAAIVRRFSLLARPLQLQAIVQQLLSLSLSSSSLLVPRSPGAEQTAVTAGEPSER